MVKLKILCGRFKFKETVSKAGEIIDVLDKDFEKFKREQLIGTALELSEKKQIEDPVDKKALRFEELSKKNKLNDKEKKELEILSKEYGEILPEE